MQLDSTFCESAFQRMASLVRVRDVATPFADEIWNIESIGEREVLEKLSRVGKLGDPVLARGDFDFVGVYLSPMSFDVVDPEHNEPLKDKCKQVYSDHLLSADTPLLQAIEILSYGQMHVVIEHNKFIGIIRPQDLMTPAGRVTLFAMTLELEMAAMKLCSHFAEQCFEALPKGRQDKALATWEERYRTKLSANMSEYRRRFGDSWIARTFLDCTTFIDKQKMICKCKLTAESHNFIRSVFHRAENLRNACAHPALVDDAAPFDPKELLQLYKDCHYLIETFSAMVPKSRTG